MGNSLSEFIRYHPIFSSLSLIEKTKTLPFLKLLSVEKGEQIFIPNDTTDYVYFVISGKISTDIMDEKFKVTEEKIFGLEGILGQNTYNYSAKSESDAILVRIQSKKLLELMNKYPKISIFLLSGKNTIKEEKKEEQNEINSQNHLTGILAWIFAAIIPLLTYNLLGDYLDYSQKIFVSLFFSGVALWMFNVIHESIPGLLIVIVTAMLNIIPNNVIGSGFSSNTALLFLSLSGLSTIIVSSGLLYRFSLLIVKYTPKKFINAVLLIFGLILTPIIPSMVNRAQLVVSVAKDIASAFNIKNGSILATKMAVSCFFGTTICSNLVITGSLMNFLAVGFLPDQTRFSLDSIGWVKIAILPCALILLANIIALPLIFYSKEKPEADINTTKEQINLMGPLSQKEIYSTNAILLFWLAIMFIPFHFISIVWISMFLFASLLSLKCIDLKDWAEKTNWGFFLFISAVTGIGAGIKALGLDAVLKKCILYATQSTLTNEFSVITFIILVCLMIRFLLPVGPAFVVMMSIAIPVSEMSGINLIAIMFTILIVADVWFFPYQAQFYTIFETEFGNSLLYDKKKFFIYNTIVNVSRISSIYISIPYWKTLGII